jgi:dynein heavy chain
LVHVLFALLQVPPYVNFLRPNMEVPPYEPVQDMAALKDTLTEKLEDFALEPGAKPLDLVLFKWVEACPQRRVVPFGRVLCVCEGLKL